MRFKVLLICLSLVFFALFTLFSYSVAKEFWQQIDFDTTVKLQDKISRKFDPYFSYFSILGSAEVTVGIALLFAAFSLIKFKWFAVLGWLVVIPATFFEVFGKLVIFHPGPPVLFHRNVLETDLPSFYVHTDFSYPSGHMTRTIFLLTVFIILVLASKKNWLFKIPVLSALIFIAFMMTLTRIYLGEHWFSDVIGGGILGFSSALFAASLIVDRKK